MPRKSEFVGVEPKGADRIQLTFNLPGVGRVRPTVLVEPTHANLAKWDAILNKGVYKHGKLVACSIKQRILDGDFNMVEEFPSYRFMAKIAPEAASNGKLTLNDVVRKFLDEECVARLRRDEISHSTITTYRKVLARNWQKPLGSRPFFAIQLSELRGVANKLTVGKKSYNNIVSALRSVFEYGYMDKPQDNPAKALVCLTLLAKDRADKKPFSIDEAERIIAGMIDDHGEAQGIYDEVRFFTGMRPSEQIALTVADYDAKAGTLLINKARVEARDKDYTKTKADRVVKLCPRAAQALNRLLVVRAQLKLQGKIDHDKLFFHPDGKAFHDLQVQGRRWNKTLERLGVEQRDPYNARHSSVTWNLMLNPFNAIEIAEQHGHSTDVMWKEYQGVIKGARDADAERAAIKRAMEQRPVFNQLRKAA